MLQLAEEERVQHILIIDLEPWDHQLQQLGHACSSFRSDGGQLQKMISNTTSGHCTMMMAQRARRHYQVSTIVYYLCMIISSPPCILSEFDPDEVGVIHWTSGTTVSNDQQL